MNSGSVCFLHKHYIGLFYQHSTRVVLNRSNAAYGKSVNQGFTEHPQAIQFSCSMLQLAWLWLRGSHTSCMLSVKASSKSSKELVMHQSIPGIRSISDIDLINTTSFTICVSLLNRDNTDKPCYTERSILVMYTGCPSEAGLQSLICLLHSS